MSWRVATALIAGVVLGAASTLGILRYWDAASIPSGWYPLQTSGRGISYLTPALFGVDIDLPSPEVPSGEAKFVPNDDRTSARLGYRVKVRIPSLDVSKIPAKYRRPVKHAGGWEELPLEQVTYEASFSFRLKDRDGFVLAELESQSHHIRSGEDNVFQGVAGDWIAAAMARRIREVEVQMVVAKCMSCR